ncbi:MAG: hypothetical protein LHV68_09745 [Elusimicrobia bacterium]|nr:hypothetical protein [Candidatus Liberimonas magnetica]
MNKYRTIIMMPIVFVLITGCDSFNQEIRFAEEWNDNPKIMLENAKRTLALNRITKIIEVGGVSTDMTAIEFGIIIPYPKETLGRINVNFVYIDKNKNTRTTLSDDGTRYFVGPEGEYFDVKDPVSDIGYFRVVFPIYNPLKRGDYYVCAEFNGKVLSEGNFTIN